MSTLKPIELIRALLLGAWGVAQLLVPDSTIEHLLYLAVGLSFLATALFVRRHGSEQKHLAVRIAEAVVGLFCVLLAMYQLAVQRL